MSHVSRLASRISRLAGTILNNRFTDGIAIAPARDLAVQENTLVGFHRRQILARPIRPTSSEYPLYRRVCERDYDCA